MIDRLKRLARLWFTFESPVDRRTYFRHGLGLMLVKYGVDATLIWSFAGMPFVVGELTAFLFTRRYPASLKETNETVLLTLAFVGGAAFILGSEGAACLLMAFPLAASAGVVGGIVGRMIALRDTQS